MFCSSLTTLCVWFLPREIWEDLYENLIYEVSLSITPGGWKDLLSQPDPSVFICSSWSCTKTFWEEATNDAVNRATGYVRHSECPVW